jgi:hypothetical protein
MSPTTISEYYFFEEKLVIKWIKKNRERRPYA